MAGTLTFFIGNGLSRINGLPSWDEFANKIINELFIRKIINFNEKSLYEELPLKDRISEADHMFKTNNF